MTHHPGRARPGAAAAGGRPDRRWRSAVVLAIAPLVAFPGCGPGAPAGGAPGGGAAHAAPAGPGLTPGGAAGGEAEAPPGVLRDALASAERLLDEVRADPQALADGNWVRVHWLLAFGPDAYADPPRPQEFHRLLGSILRADESAYPEPPFVVRRGRPHPRAEGAPENRQFHRDQFLGYLSLVGVPLDAPLRVEGQDFRLRDLMDGSLLEGGSEGEHAWTLTAYSQYLPPDCVRTNKYGERLTVAALLQSALDHEGVACGGAHFLNALALVRRNPSWRRDAGLAPLWPRVEARLRAGVVATRAAQRPGGEFATAGALPQALQGTDRVVADVYRTGHTLEWLANALEDEALRSEWVVGAVAALCRSTAVERERISGSGVGSIEVSWRRSNIGHAASALARWTARVRGAAAGGQSPGGGDGR